MNELDDSRTVTPVSAEDVQRLAGAWHGDPFAVLGLHRAGTRAAVRAFLPGAAEVSVDGRLPLVRRAGTDLFEWEGDAGAVSAPYRLVWRDGAGTVHDAHDPYAFGSCIPDFDLHLFGEGRHRHPQRFLGANPRTIDAVAGVLFATWAPNAERVSVVGDFNDWDGRRHPMRALGSSGVWELFLPDVGPGALYKFEIRTRSGGLVLLKTDPYGKAFEYRPRTATRVTAPSAFAWGDAEWLAARGARGWLHEPMSIYEVHLGSWQREDGAPLGYRALAERLVEHVRALGFTHVELLPVAEHPLDASWGYQTTGYFAPTSRYGEPDDFRWFVDHCHRNGVGVLLDWAPAHFPRDAHALARFDGTALYEHEDPRLGEHRDWGTLIFNYGRHEVRDFLVANALYWLDEFHVDGLRVDAVASMLYLDYSRRPGDWIPNRYGGNENIDAIDFLREMNAAVLGEHAGAVTIAEESTSWPQVTRPPWVGGLGFSMKWNMGWMHDTLDYLGHDPVHRSWHHDRLTFGMLYAFSENFVLPFSHDEVVHEKRSLLGRMPGDDWQRFANLRLLYTYMWTYPGKKLLFMGGEIAMEREWDHERALDWWLLDRPLNRGVHTLVADLNRLYRARPALSRHDFEGCGFEWIDCHDTSQSVVSYQRRAGDEIVVVVLNFTPVPRHGYRIGVPRPGRYAELLNSDAGAYGGSNVGNGGGVSTEPVAWMGHPCSLVLTVPPLAGIVLAPEPPSA